MSIASEIARLQNAKLALKTSINAKTDNNHQITNETLEDYSTFVDSISAGGGVSFKIDDANSLFYDGARLNILNNLLSICENVTSTLNMFYNCKTLSTLDLSNFNTSNVTTMQNMFRGCSNLTSLNLSNFNTSNVTDMSMMFDTCTSLQQLDLNDFDTSETTTMQQMFYYCQNLNTLCINSNKFNSSKVTTMYQMFYGTKIANLAQLDASSCINISYFMGNNSYLTTFGGLNNLGNAYLTTRNANYSSYTLNLSGCSNLTEQSLINVLNGLYDIATKGCNTQSCVLGSTNLAKLTSQAGQVALSNAQTKGWTIS